MLLDFLQFIARVWTHVTSSIITIMVQDTMVSCFDDCGYLLVDLFASTLTHSQYTLYIAARVILLKHNINHAVHMLCSKFSSLPISLRTTAKVLTTTYLDSVLKAETSLCRESIVKAMVFPVVMYICESWTIKLDHKEGWALKNWCFQIVVLEKTLESPLDSKEIKPVNPKGNQTWPFTGRADAEAKVPILSPPDMKSQLIGKDPDTGKDGRQEEKRVTEDEMVDWHHWLNGREFEQTPRDSEGQGSLACCRPWGHKESDMT